MAAPHLIDQLVAASRLADMKRTAAHNQTLTWNENHHTSGQHLVVHEGSYCMARAGDPPAFHAPMYPLLDEDSHETLAGRRATPAGSVALRK